MKKIIFHQDSAPAYKSVLAMGKLWDFRYDLLGHPPPIPVPKPEEICF